MKLNFAIAAAATVLAAALASAQTAAEKLEKAIYTQNTAGDVDAALQMYRDIVASAPQQKQIAAQAQYRLAMALMQKGELDAAQREFQNLAFNFSEYKDLIASMARRTRGIQQGMSLTLGTLTDERGGPSQKQTYHHKLTNVEFSVPSSLGIMGDSDSSGGGEIVVLSEKGTQAFAAVWLKPNDPNSHDIPGQLQRALQAKAGDRQDFQDWKVRPESVLLRTVGGQQALSAVADYTDGSVKMAEYLTWVYSPKSHVLFFGRTTWDSFPAFQAHLDQVVNSAKIP
jgi:tetratricopeptide (TPR) repeat protein